MADLQLVAAIPESLLETMNPLKLAKFIFTQRSVDWREFQFSQEELAQRQEARADQQNAETATEVAKGMQKGTSA